MPFAAVGNPPIIMQAVCGPCLPIRSLVVTLFSPMKKIAFLLSCLLLGFSSFAQLPASKGNYELAARFSPDKLKKMIFSTSVDPHWMKKSDRFWYEYETSQGKKWVLVDPIRRTKTPLFDNVKMAKWLSEITKDPYEAKHLPRFNFTFTKDEKAIRFYVTSNEEVDVKEDDANQSLFLEIHQTPEKSHLFLILYFYH